MFCMHCDSCNHGHIHNSVQDIDYSCQIGCRLGDYFESRRQHVFLLPSLKHGNNTFEWTVGTGQNRTESKVVTGIGGDDVYFIVLSSVHHVSLLNIWSNKMKIANGCIHRGSGTTFSGSPSTMISLFVGLTGMHIILHIQLAQGDHLWYRVHWCFRMFGIFHDTYGLHMHPTFFSQV